jgi:phosphate transport system substrate-binding protein
VKSKSLCVWSILLLVYLLVACGADSKLPSPMIPSPTTAIEPTPTLEVRGFNQPTGGYTVSFNGTLKGGGSSFPNPVYQRWIPEFNKINPNLRFTYDVSGDIAGMDKFYSGEYEFGSTTVYPSDEALKKYGKEVVTIPTVLGAIVIIYNLPGVAELRLSSETLGDIFTRKITKWSDAKISAENGNISFPDIPINIAVRAESDGSTEVFTNWLAEANEPFRKLGIAGSKPDWSKAGITFAPASQDDGVAKVVRENIGSISYVEAVYASSNNLKYASIKNSAGNYVRVNQPALISAATLAVPNNLKLKLTNAPDPQAYPIAATTWIVIPREIPNKDRAEALLKYLWWVTADQNARQLASNAGYAPFPQLVVIRIQNALRTVTSNGQPII